MAGCLSQAVKPLARVGHARPLLPFPGSGVCRHPQRPQGRCRGAFGRRGACGALQSPGVWGEFMCFRVEVVHIDPPCVGHLGSCVV